MRKRYLHVESLKCGRRRNDNGKIDITGSFKQKVNIVPCSWCYLNLRHILSPE